MNLGKLSGAGLAALAALAVLLSAVGPAAAADVVATNETVAIDDNTQSVYAEVNNTGSSQANYSVEYIGLDSDGNQTFNETRSGLSTTANTTELVERSSLNATTTDEVRVIVTLDNSSVAESDFSASVGTIQKVASGSGGLFGDGSGAVPVGAVVAIGLAGLVLRSRD